MSDDIQARYDALQSENQSLKSVLDQVSTEKQSWRQTSNELLEANIQLKSTLTLYDKQLTLHKGIIADKNREIEELRSASNQ